MLVRGFPSRSFVPMARVFYLQRADNRSKGCKTVVHQDKQQLSTLLNASWGKIASFFEHNRLFYPNLKPCKPLVGINHIALRQFLKNFCKLIYFVVSFLLTYASYIHYIHFVVNKHNVTEAIWTKTK